MNTNGFFIRGDFEGLDSRTEREKFADGAV